MIQAFIRGVAPLLILTLICCVAAAAPAQPQVTAGQATFAQQGRVFAITNTPGTVINWQSFNIGAGEVTRFIQQGADSAVLNRVVGQDPTRILGALQSNGKVFLINPNGILFGQGARVDVNGLVASSLNLGDADFLAGRKRFETARTGAGSVQNAGAITTPAGGQVILIAPQVENTGIITSPQGAVILAAGHSVQLADSADPDVQVVLSAPAHAAVNLGQVIAAGGRVGIYGALVRQAGLVSADSAVVGASGRIVLKAGGTATLAAGSATHAVGRAGADGGTVEVLGAAVAIDAGAQVDASGRNGGAVLVGGDWQGDWQGGGSAPRAQQTTFAAGAVIRADGDAGGGVEGGSGGSGGKVVLWSDGATLAQGRISAHGGGAGGRVETSGRTLDVDGLRVDAAGRINGTWLLDPYDVEVVAGGTAGAGAVAVAGPDSKSGVTRVAPATLTAPGTNIVLHAQHDLTVTDALDAAASVFAQAGHDITVNARVASAGAGNDDSLTFLAGNAFTLGANGMLRSGNNIYIEANRIRLDGAIAGTSGLLPRLGLSTTDVTLPIDIGVNGANNALMLDPRILARLAPTLAEIDIGTDRHTGAITIDGALGMATSLVLSNSGAIRVAAPVDLGANGGNAFFAHVFGNRGTLDVTGALTAADVRLTADRLALGGALTAGSVTLQPDSAATRIGVGGSDGGSSDGSSGFVVGGAALAAIQAARVSIGAPGGRGGIGVDGAVALSGIGVLALDAGSGPLAITAPLATAHTLVLASRAVVSESGAGKIDAAALAVRGADVTLGGANAIGTLAGAATHGFQVTAQGALSIGDVDGLSGIGAAGASVVLDAAGIDGAGVVQAGSLVLQSSAGIGSAGAPLRTRTDTLVARNDGIGGQPVNIANAGALTLQLATNAGAGAITIDNDGVLTVPPYVADTAADTVADMRGAVRTIDGDIALTARGALTIAGRVGTTGGNVRLAADGGGLLTIEPGALVSSVRGRVTHLAAAEDIAPGTIRDVDSAPLLGACTTAPLTPGCAAVLAAAVRACAADPDGAGCTATVAQFAVLCAASPGAAGCADIAGGAAGRTDGQGVQLAQAQQAAVRLIDTGAHDVAAPGSAQQGGSAGTGAGTGTGTGQDGGERTAGPVHAQEAGAKTGAKNDKPAKTYCN